jgi:hypothetical protein
MSTKEAFEILLSTKGIHHELGLSSEQLATIRFNYNKGKISLDRMEELLIKAGFRKVPEYWHKP